MLFFIPIFKNGLTVNSEIRAKIDYLFCFLHKCRHNIHCSSIWESDKQDVTLFQLVRMDKHEFNYFAQIRMNRRNRTPGKLPRGDLIDSDLRMRQKNPEKLTAGVT